ncbi:MULTISPECIES: hypothetical protein [unclassified Bradyrhizobium]|uniref:hypothetical protein n=1 Tax=unclassified Bradyrhizobium TaxID=2631580 RepID=UPI0028E9E3CF|nr:MULTISPECIES: hypothetical protein [unclassified Bradyrhizobium]
MNIDDNKKSRATLKSYFVKNAIPTEQQFSQLIDSLINQRDDGVIKPGGGEPLSIEAVGDFEKAINFYMQISDASPAWTLSLRPRSNPNDPQTGRPGLSINDAAGNSRLAVDAANGRVGIGVVAPAERLEVGGRIRAGLLTIGAPDVNVDYSYVGGSAAGDLTTTYALAVGISGAQLGRTALNGKDISFRVNNVQRATFAANGHLGIGTPSPAAMLDVAGVARFGSLSIGPWPANGNYVHFGVTTLNQAAADNYALLQSAAGDDFGTTYLNSPETIQFRIKNVSYAELQKDGDFNVKRSLSIGGSDLYFTKTDHNHTGIGNKLGYAAIENGANYGGLMILGRTVNTSPLRRVVKVWDYLEVNGDLLVTGRIGSMGKGPNPLTPGWGGGMRTWDLEAEGTVWSRGPVQTGPRDLAEIYFAQASLAPGDVVSLDPDSEHIVLAPEANCSRVIGVISTEPGMLLNSLINREDLPADGSKGFPVALSGCVPCKVTDEGGPIRRGDLLTAASRPGYAMRAAPATTDGAYRAGTIIGKALGAHTAGEGLIEIFVMLH